MKKEIIKTIKRLMVARSWEGMGLVKHKGSGGQLNYSVHYHRYDHVSLHVCPKPSMGRTKSEPYAIMDSG